MNLIRTAVRNPVAVNIVMAGIIVLGLVRAFTIVREFFPNSDLDRVVITTPFPGATPEEIEKGVTTRIETAIEGVTGIEEITSRVLENQSLVIAKVKSSADLRIVADDIKKEIDRITDFPVDAEDSIVTILEQQIPVISLVVFGSADERTLKRIAEDIKDDLIASSIISKVQVSGTRNEEISIEVDAHQLMAYNLTMEEVGRAVRQNNVDLAGGEMKATEGKLVVRTLGEDRTGLALEQIILRASADGTTVRLSDVAVIKDGFEETVLRGLFQDQRAVQVTVFKNPDEDSVLISRHVREYLESKRPEFAGDSVQIEYRNDLARFIAQRIELMSRNGLQGLVLVFLCLALFLNLRLAFWVSVGIAVSFMGTFLVMPHFGATINLISLFGLILVLGLIVDDAIVVAENVYAHMERGVEPHLAAVHGTEEVTRPVTGAVTTTCIAFLPLAFIQGVVGDFMSVLPVVVIASLLFSLVESLFILPSHLAESGTAILRRRAQRAARGATEPTRWERIEKRIGGLRDRYVTNALREKYLALLQLALRWRYVTLASAIFVSAITIALIVSGALPFVLFQKVDSETVVAELEMATGTSAEQTEQVLAHIARAALEISEVRNAYSVVGFKEEEELQALADPAVIGEVIVELLTSEERDRDSDTITQDWRNRVGELAGVKKLTFRERQGGPGGAEIEMRIIGANADQIEQARRHVRELLSSYQGVVDIDDDQDLGKLEVRLKLKESARSLGISVEDLARQMRGAYFGYEAQVLQRGREEVKVYVRLEEEQRKSLPELLRLRIKTPEGERVPISEVADVRLERGITSISRLNLNRTVTVTADVDFNVTNTGAVTESLTADLADFSTKFPGLSIRFDGKKKETSESLGSLAYGFPIAMLAVYCVLAVIFRSYVQPLVVMIAIPYGVVGACLGHLIFGLIPGREAMPVTFLSLIGIVGLSGIVVNDSLILVEFINFLRRDQKMKTFDAVVEAGRRRFRPILLTSLTTVLGLFPLLLERSFQAQFLIPMGISMSFGLALATVLTLVLLPSLYLVMEDIRKAWHWLRTGRWEDLSLEQAPVFDEVARSESTWTS